MQTLTEDSKEEDKVSTTPYGIDILIYAILN